MATRKSKAANRLGAFDLSETIEEKLAQAMGICSAVGLAVDHAEVIPEEGLRNALWAARELMNDALEAARALHHAKIDAPAELASVK